MAVCLNDSETEQIVLQFGLLTPDGLSQFRRKAENDANRGLFELLLESGVISDKVLKELEAFAGSNEVPAPSPQNKPSSPPPQANPSIPPVTATQYNLRKGKRRGFDDSGAEGVGTSKGAPTASAFQDPPQQRPVPCLAPQGNLGAELAPKAKVDEEKVHNLSSAGRPEGWPGGMAPEQPHPGGIQEYLKQARALGASDLHLCVGLPPMVRLAGQLRPLVEGRPGLLPADTQRLIREVLTPAQWCYFEKSGDLDFCYAFSSGGRFRANVLQQRLGWDLAFRVIAGRIMSLEELGLPLAAKRLTEFPMGLVLVTGPSGAGKTTTLMALVDMVNQNRHDHIITVEEPIEFILEPRSCQVTQREVGAHTQGFDTALRAALREDPDIMVIGELRDYETTSMAINASETGHLVFCSLPTQDAAKTIDKVLDYFPPEEQGQIRMMVSESLRGILSQQLVPRKDGRGRVAAVELLFNTVGVANIIREGKTAGLINAMQLGKNLGMVLMDESLRKLLDEGVISPEEAYLRASNKEKFKV